MTASLLLQSHSTVFKNVMDVAEETALAFAVFVVGCLAIGALIGVLVAVADSVWQWLRGKLGRS